MYFIYVKDFTRGLEWGVHNTIIAPLLSMQPLSCFIPAIPLRIMSGRSSTYAILKVKMDFTINANAGLRLIQAGKLMQVLVFISLHSSSHNVKCNYKWLQVVGLFSIIAFPSVCFSLLIKW